MNNTLIGKSVKTLSGEEITVKNEKIINGKYVYTDTEGNIYSEDELDLRFMLSKECLLYEALKENGLCVNWSYKRFAKIVENFMSSMVAAGYISKRE